MKGSKGRSFLDLVWRKQRLVTAKQFSIPRLCNDIVRRPWKGAQTSSSPANQTRSKVQNAATKAVCRVHRMRDRGQRRDDDAQRLSQNAADLKEHVQHTSWTCQWACASRIRSGPIQTKPVFNCGFSLYPPPPPQPPAGCACPLKLNEGGHVLGVNHRERDRPLNFTTTVDLQALDAKSATLSNGQCTVFLLPHLAKALGYHLRVYSPIYSV